MKVELYDGCRDVRVKVDLSGGRRVLAGFLGLLQAESIFEIRLSDYEEVQLPRELSRFSALKAIHFEHCHGLTEYPAILGRCAALCEVGFYRCADLHRLDGIGECAGLRCLHLCGCESLSLVGEPLGSATGLLALDLSHSLSLVSVAWGSLPAGLRILDLGGCRNLAIPEDIGEHLTHVVSVSIQDWAHGAETLLTWSRLDALQRRLCASAMARDGAGFDD